MADHKSIEQLSFEEALKELERIVAELESGETPLERSISLYERGSKLKLQCEATLKSAEERVERIVLDPAGNPTGTERFSPN